VIIDDARGGLIPTGAAVSIALSSSKKRTPYFSRSMALGADLSLSKVRASTVYYKHQLPNSGAGAIFLPARQWKSGITSVDAALT
jgi:hypothetical protein